MGQPAEFDLKINKGDTYHLVLHFDDDAGDSIDLTSNLYRAQARPSSTSSSYVDFAIDITNAATGTLVLSLTAQQTAALRDGVWSLREIDAYDEATTLLVGDVITRATATQ